MDSMSLDDRQRYLEARRAEWIATLHELLGTLRDFGRARRLPVVPLGITTQLDETIRWYNANRNGIEDSEKQWMFLLETTTKLLCICHAIIVEFDCVPKVPSLHGLHIDGRVAGEAYVLPTRLFGREGVR